VKVRPDPQLIDEVTNLVEWPVAVVGEFDAEFLHLPPEVIVSAMRGHQRYFACGTEASLENKFVTIAGTVVAEPAVVKHGNERVLSARLADARFFWDEDRKHSLDEHAQKLGGVVFQAKLGTLADKVARLKGLAWPKAKLFGRAVELCKADLVTKMVGEFPDLQGVMGRHYAAGEPEVGQAIFEHYLPRNAGDSLPQADLGAEVGIADRTDTIVGCFAIGLAPTGSTDAYGLRRAGLAVLNLLEDRKWTVSLGTLVDDAAMQYGTRIPWAPAVRAQILEFLQTRLRGLLIDRKLASDCVDAALAAGYDNVPDAFERAQAVSRLRDRPDFEPLGAAFKRVANILKGERVEGDPDPARFTDASEKALWQSFAAVRSRVEESVKAQRYDAALGDLATLKPAVDKFFDDVLVMDKDPQVKANRLALLGAIDRTFRTIADFRQLAVG
jgi:glycyl-tRNA synthetase beta chain